MMIFLEKEAGKMEEEEEEENSPSITVMHNFEGENSLPKPDDRPTQDCPGINSNECIYESMK
jgi:hypothetical protein